MGRVTSMNILIKLFWNFLKIGAFSYGGGYTALSLIEREIVSRLNWLSYPEFLDVMAVSQITPGPIGINSATYTGFKIAGIGGAFVSTFGVVLVSFVLVIVIAHYFFQFKDSKVVKAVLYSLRPAILGIIITVVINLGKVTIVGIKEAIITLVVVVALIKFERHPIVMIFLSGVIGIFIF